MGRLFEEGIWRRHETKDLVQDEKEVVTLHASFPQEVYPRPLQIVGKAGGVLVRLNPVIDLADEYVEVEVGERGLVSGRWGLV